MLAHLSAPPCAAHDPAPRKPGLVLPNLACDTHAHVCGPESQYPYWPGRIYTPPDALPSQYGHLLQVLGVQRAVLVQPSVYGSDNTAMLDALAAKVRPFGWHLEFLMHVDEFPDLDRLLDGFPVDVVFGHLGYMKAGLGLDAPGYQALLRLMKSGRAWVKLTGPYCVSAQWLPYADVVPYAHALVDAAPDRVVWGSDWPHVTVKGAMPNDGDLCDLLADWVPDEDARRRVLVYNPAKLYGF